MRGNLPTCLPGKPVLPIAAAWGFVRTPSSNEHPPLHILQGPSSDTSSPLQENEKKPRSFCRWEICLSRDLSTKMTRARLPPAGKCVSCWLLLSPPLSFLRPTPAAEDNSHLRSPHSTCRTALLCLQVETASARQAMPPSREALLSGLIFHVSLSQKPLMCLPLLFV